MKGRINVGMIGVGGFGAWRRKLMRDTGLFRVTAVCDRAVEVARQAAEEEGAEVSDSFDRMLARDDVDAVVISTGADSHHGLAIAALAARKHVFVEKPLCVSVEQALALRNASEATGAPAIVVGHTHPDDDGAANLIDHLRAQGQLGEIAAYEANSSHSGGLQIKAGDWRGKREANPGGMLFQCGVHELFRLVRLFGPVSQVQAMFRYDVHGGTETADVASVLLRHTSGLTGTLNCYHVTGYCHELRIFGTRGNVYLDTHGQQAWHQPRKQGEVEERSPLAWPRPGDGTAALRAWAAAIAGAGAPVPTVRQAADALLPVFAAEIADQQGRRVNIEELMAPMSAEGICT